jgi:YD repeat-containing protein
MSNRLTSFSTRIIDGQPETVTHTRQYDKLNRLTTTIDPEANTTTTEYNSIGKRTRTLDKLGRETLYDYDTLNRLTYLENKDLTTASIISSYAHELGSAGNRVAVPEDTGRRVEYAYDSIYRLVDESIYDDGVTLPEVVGLNHSRGRDIIICWN